MYEMQIEVNIYIYKIDQNISTPYNFIHTYIQHTYIYVYTLTHIDR